MQYKYMKIPVLTEDEHQRVEAEGLPALKEIVGECADDTWTYWIRGGQSYTLNLDGEVATSSIMESSRRGNEIIDELPSQPGIVTLQNSPALNEAFVLKAIAAAAHPNAAEALCKS